MAVTLKDLKVKWRWKARSKMTFDQLEYFTNYVKKKRDETIKLEMLLKHQNLACDEWIIVSPMFLPLRRKETPDKKESLNMNSYRNWDFMKSNILKQDYKELMKDYIPNLWELKDIHIEYKIFYGKNEPDGMNIASVQSKFFLDTLQELWYLSDDNISNVTESYSNGWKDIWNERIEIKIIKKVPTTI